MKTPDIMTSFVHDSLTWVGWGGAGAATVQMLPLLASPSLSPLLTVAEPECVLCVYLYESVCAHA